MNGVCDGHTERVSTRAGAPRLVQRRAIGQRSRAHHQGGSEPEPQPVAPLREDNDGDEDCERSLYAHTCALVDSDAIYCWGNDFEGQLGPNGSRNSANGIGYTPLLVSGF
ncbi:MAG TPA: RCC1 domain-containing protein [Polyangiaceae bacterium]